MVVIPNTTGVESADTNVIGRRSPGAQDWVAIIAKKYRSNSEKKMESSLINKTRCGKLSNDDYPLPRASPS